MKLYTSIPPKVSRDVDGQDVGHAWTRMCIDSWKRAGYQVVSVNSGKETTRIRELHPDIDVFEVDRDGTPATGRPLVYLSDILSVALQQNPRYFAIANADVLFLTDAASALNGWEPAEGFAYSTRLDIDDLNCANPRLHGGMDFIILSAQDLTGFDFPDFLFGTPWWDYWLPLALTCKGVKSHRLQHKGLPVIAHLFHKDQWSHEQFVSNFILFSNALSKMIGERGKWPNSVYTVDGATGLPGPMLKMCVSFAKASSAMVHEESRVIDIGGNDPG